MTDDDLQALHIRLPKELHKRLKLESVHTGRSMADLVTEAIRDLLEKREG